MRSTILPAALLAGTWLALSGCYTYTAVAVSDVPLGASVRAQVTPRAADRAQPILGYNASTLDGVVLQRGGDSLLLRVPAQTFAEGGSLERFHQQLELAPAELVQLQMRRLDVTRTVGLAALGVAALVFIGTRTLGGTSGGSAGPPGGGNSRALVVPIR